MPELQTSLMGTTIMSIEYSERIIAFVDILGFGTIVATIDKHPERHEQIQGALRYLKGQKTSYSQGIAKALELEISAFSDSIVLSTRANQPFDVIHACGWLQANLLGSGILVRGGISSGKTVHADDILYGEGMLKAYRLESSAAIYPRIVVDPSVVDLINWKMQEAFLGCDADGLWFVDPFKFDGSVGGAVELAADGWDPHELYLEDVGRHIENGLNAAEAVDHRAKWTWMGSRYAEAREAYLRDRILMSDRLAEIAARSDDDGEPNP